MTCLVCWGEIKSTNKEISFVGLSTTQMSGVKLICFSRLLSSYRDDGHLKVFSCVCMSLSLSSCVSLSLSSQGRQWIVRVMSFRNMYGYVGLWSIGSDFKGSPVEKLEWWRTKSVSQSISTYRLGPSVGWAEWKIICLEWSNIPYKHGMYFH